MSKVRKVDYYADEYIVGVSRLTFEEQGVYWMICSLVTSHGGPIEADYGWIGGLGRMGAAKVRNVVKRLVDAGKLIETGGKISQKRAENEVKSAQNRIITASENGKKGGRPPSKINDLEKAGGYSGEKLTTNYQLPSSSSLRSEEDSSDLFPESAEEEPASSEEASAAGQGRRPYPPWFEAIWTAYPATKRKTAKVAVFREVQKAIKRDGYPPDRLLVAVEAYARHAAAEGWLDGGDDFTKAPETFFRQGAYEAFLDGAGPGQAAGSKPPRRGARIDTTG